MNKTITKMLTFFGLFLIFYAVVAVIATFSQLADSADRVYGGAGQPVFWSLLALFSGLVLYPVFLLLQLPKAMKPPRNISDPEYPQYRNWLKQHLTGNRNTDIQRLAKDDNVEGALDVIHREADLLIRNTASGVFVSTALIQNGRLDGIVMLASQMRLVWQVAALYNLRPSPRQLWYLYSNVGGTMLLSTNLEDVDFAELASPIVNSVAPSLVSAVPGLQGVGNLLVNSLANGSANAFLTLRVGLIAKAYCAPLIEPDQRVVRKSATLAALGMLKGISKEKGGALAKEVWSGVTGVVGRAVESVAASTKSAAGKTVGAVKSAADKTASAVGSAGTMAKDAVVNSAEVVQTTTGKVVDVVGDVGRNAWDVSRTAAGKAANGAKTLASGTSKVGVSAVNVTKAASAGVVKGAMISGAALNDAANSVLTSAGLALHSTAQLFSDEASQSKSPSHE